MHSELRDHNNPPDRGLQFFTGGFVKAVAKLEREHAGFVLVAAAVQKYNNLEASQVTPQYGVVKGLKMFGEDGVTAIKKEFDQLHTLKVISPVHPRDLSREEVKGALPYLIFLKRKR